MPATIKPGYIYFRWNPKLETWDACAAKVPFELIALGSERLPLRRSATTTYKVRAATDSQGSNLRVPVGAINEGK